jgi:hypothetical protein
VEVAATGGLTSTLGVGKSALVGNVSVFRWMVIVTLALSAACSSSGSDGVVPLAAPADTSGEPAPPTTTRPDDPVVTTISPWNEEQLEVIAAFEAAELAFRRAELSVEDGDYQRVLDTRTADAGRRAVERLQALAADRVATRFPSGIEMRVAYLSVGIEGDVALIEACEVDDAVIYSVDGGAVRDDRVVTLQWVAQLRRVGGEWLFDALRVDSEWSGDVGCDG